MLWKQLLLTEIFFRHNLCDSSEYGFWLGYSYNSIIDSNEINYNQYAGIAIERGFNNVITNNTFLVNPYGVQLWEAGIASGYETWSSHDYTISANTFSGNTPCDKCFSNGELHDGWRFFSEKIMRQFILTAMRRMSTCPEIILMPAPSMTFKTMLQMTLTRTVTSFSIAIQISSVTKFTTMLMMLPKEIVNITPYTCNILPVYQTAPPNDLAEPPAVWYPYPEGCWLARHYPTAHYYLGFRAQARWRCISTP